MQQLIIDVRERDEFDADHIIHSIHLPLGDFEARAPNLLQHFKEHEIVLMCRSGRRAKLARDQLKNLELSPHSRVTVYEGGILRWKEEGKPTVSLKERHFPIMRQVQIGAGSLVVLSVVASYLVDPKFILLAGFVGAGLTVAGVTGFCGMAELLIRMPWNRVRS